MSFVSEKRLAEEIGPAIVKNMPIVAVNLKGIIEYANDKAEDLLNFHRSELVGQPVEILVPAYFKELHVKRRDDFMDDPHTRPMGVGALNLAALRKDGSEVPVEIMLQKVVTEVGTFVVAILCRRRA